MKFSSGTPWEDDLGESVLNEATAEVWCPASPRFGGIASALLVAIVGSAGVIAGAFYWFNHADANDPTKRMIAAELVERPALVQPREEIKNGDFVVIRPNAFNTPKVQQVAAKPNETVIVRRRGVLEGLYMLGEKSGYVVVSDREPTRIVQPEDITGALVSTPPKPAE